MKKGLAIAFFVIAIIICVSRIGTPWSLFQELLVGSVENASDDTTIDQIETRIYALGGIEWAYVYELDGELEINVEGREFDHELRPDFCRNISEEVMCIVDDYGDKDLGFIYIYQNDSVDEDSISWYTNNGQYGYFVYTVDGEDYSYDNVTPDEMEKLINEEHKNNISVMGGALG